MHSIKKPLYQTEQIRAFERLAEESFHLTPAILMERAGKAAFDFMRRRWPDAQRIVVFCGAGNNGGDGYVLAYLAKEQGIKVDIWQVGLPDPQKAEAYAAYKRCEKSAIPMYAFHPEHDLGHPDLIIDALCGIGLQKNLKDNMVQAIKKIQQCRVPIFSIDIPTGIDADTGCVMGVALRASATLTFIGLKLGLLTGSGSAYTGELALNDLQLPSDLYEMIPPIAEKIDLACFANYLAPRPRDWHKGLSGHVLVVGGDYGYSGAVRMAAEAALRVGAGLVSVATRPENAISMNATRPEIMCHGIKSIDDLGPLIDKADIIILGPGLGKSTWSKSIWERIIHVPKPLVIDADALNLLAENPITHSQWILTPHPGEAARLLQFSTEKVQQDRLYAAQLINKRYHGVCVLKGSGSLIVASNVLPGLCSKGNPGMASAGMGDVLSGVLGGLLAQGVPLVHAAKLGVILHASAGDLAAKEGERGMLACDLMPFLRKLANA